jgi:hypothetical protein
MFKKIHSNRQPENTLYSSIKTEFAPAFDKTDNKFQSLLGMYPKTIFISMIFLMVVSGILSFTLFRNNPSSSNKGMLTINKGNAKEREIKQKTDSGMAGIMLITQKLMAGIRLKQKIEGLIKQPKLSHQDSASLLIAIDSLEMIRKTNKPHPNENRP